MHLIPLDLCFLFFWSIFLLSFLVWIVDCSSTPFFFFLLSSPSYFNNPVFLLLWLAHLTHLPPQLVWRRSYFILTHILQPSSLHSGINSFERIIHQQKHWPGLPKRLNKQRGHNTKKKDTPRDITHTDIHNDGTGLYHKERYRPTDGTGCNQESEGNPHWRRTCMERG